MSPFHNAKMVLAQSLTLALIGGLTTAAMALGTDTSQGIPEGNWRSPCSQPDAPWGVTATEEIVVKKGVISTVTTYYADEKCQTVSVRSDWTAKQVAGKDIMPSGARPLDLTFLTAVYTPVIPDGANALNNYQWCGAKDWVVGKGKDVTSKSGADNCIGKLPSTNFTIFNVIGDKLFIGKTSSTTPDGRAKELSPTFFYTKVAAPAQQPDQPTEPTPTPSPAPTVTPPPPGEPQQPQPESLAPQSVERSLEFLNTLSKGNK